MTKTLESGGVTQTISRVRPRLTMGHSTLAARDLDALQNFYCYVLGFEVTNRGPIPGDLELAFLSQDPAARGVRAGVECMTWGESHRRALQPGNRQRLSRTWRARRIAGGTVRVLRPTSNTRPSPS